MHDRQPQDPGPIERLADQCVRCGLCSGVCPTYALDGVEPESPRGRILVMQALAGQTVAEASLLEARDHCLGCLECQRKCPSRVEYARLLDLSRRQHPPRLPAAERWLLQAVQSPWRLRLAGMLLPLARPWLLRHGFPPAAPCPPADNRPVHPRGTVALFRGCVARWADEKTHADARWLIHHAGFAVEEPPSQGCCGALHLHAGDEHTATTLAARNRQAFGDRAEVVLFTASGCGVQLQQSLGEALPVVEASHWLLQRLPEPARQEQRRIGLHLPCSLRGMGEAATMLRQRVEACCRQPVQVLDGGCCGAGGAHVLRQPERAERLRRSLLERMQGIDLLLTANIGCALHLRAGLYQQGRDLPVQHPLSWLRSLYEENPACTL